MALAIMLMNSCSNFPSKKGTSNEDIESYSNGNSKKNTSYVRIVYLVDDEEHAVTYYFALKNGNKFIMFDNQADYSEFLPEAKVINEACSKYMWGDSYSLETPKEKLVEEEKLFLKEAAHYISMFQKDKNSIKDPRLYKALDEVFFYLDYDMSNLTFNLEERDYEKQKYRGYGYKDLSLGAYAFKYPHFSDVFKYKKTIEGDMVPDGALVFLMH